MIVNMSDGATEQQIDHIMQRIREAGFQPHVTRGTERTIVAAVGSGGRRHEIEALSVAPGVDNVVAIAQPFKLVSLQTRPERSVVVVGADMVGAKAVGARKLAVGADGIIIEVHPCPERALSDGPQSLDLPQFERVMRGLSDPLPAVLGAGVAQG
jgi:hypothetical protein